MKLFTFWETWVFIYLFSAVTFAYSFKVSNRAMKKAGILTSLLELFTALFAILFLPFFKFILPTDGKVYLTLFIVTIIYAITDRLNIEARYGLEPSTFSMLKQLSTVFMILFGFFFLKEPIVWFKIVGAGLIIFANIILAFEKGKLKFNKYFIMCFISNFLFAVAMLINVNISEQFNLAFYTILTVTIPAFFILLFGRYKIKDIKEEFSHYNKKMFFVASFTWCLMLISSVRAYQLGSVTIIAPLFALTSIINAIIEFLCNRNKSKLLQKLIAAFLLIVGVILIKI